MGQTNHKLSTGRKLAFGIGDLGPAIVSGINGFFLFAFLIEIAGLRPALAGAIFLILKIWDSVNDPLIGMLTDRTRTRWGRRRPWLLFGAVPFAIAYYLHWIVPDLSQTGLFWYYLVVGILLDTGFTAVNVPYTALTPELSPDYDERTSLNAYRFAFSIMGGLVGTVGHTLLIGSADQESLASLKAAYMTSAAIWAAIIVISNIITFMYTEESYFEAEEETEHLGFFEGLKIAFSNKAFISLTTFYLLTWLAIQFVQNNFILYTNYWSKATEDQFLILLVILQLGSFLFLFVSNKVSEKHGRQLVFYVGAAIWAAAGLFLFFVPAENVTLLYVIAPFAAVGVSVCTLIPWTLLPDVVDLDELETGQRREGVFYGFFVFLQKMGLSLGIAASGFILDATGYIRPDYEGAALIADQPEAVLTALRIFVSLVPTVILLLSMVVLYYYPISRERSAEIQAELAGER